MLKVNFNDGFTGELISFDVLLTGNICEIARSSIHGKHNSEAVLFDLDEYEDGLGSLLVFMNGRIQAVLVIFQDTDSAVAQKTLQSSQSYQSWKI